MSVIQGIYIALFGRPADPGGLAYWNEVTKNGQDLAEMLRVLPSLNEYTERFDGQTPDQVITTIYQGLFGRDPDAAGLAFFKGQLDSGTLNMASLAVSIAQGAQGDDKADVQAKVDAAILFTESLDTPEEIAAYSGDAANALAKKFLDTVDKDNPATPESVEKASAAVVAGEDPTGGQAPGPGSGGPGGGTSGPADVAGEVSLSGEPEIGAEIQAEVSDPNGLSGPISYQWLAGGKEIAGATDATYRVEAGAFGRELSVRVSYTDDDGYHSVFTSEATAKVELQGEIIGPVVLFNTPGDGVGYDTVTAALAEADAGATIFVREGQYDRLEIKVEGVSIFGAPGAKLIGGVFVAPSAEGASIQGFQVSGTYMPVTASYKGAAFNVRASDVTIANNIITPSDGSTVGIETVHNLTGLSIFGNDISGFARYGIYLNPHTGAQISGNVFDENKYAVATQDGEAPEVMGNIFKGSTESDILVWAYRGTALVDLSDKYAENTYEGSSQKVTVWTSGDHQIVGTALADYIYEYSGSGNDVIDGGAGADLIRGGLGNNILVSSADGDTYVATQGEQSVTFHFHNLDHSRVGGDVTTFNMAQIEEGIVPLNVLLSADERFLGAADLIEDTNGAVALGGLAQDNEGPRNSTNFFHWREGDEIRHSEGVPTDLHVEQSLVVYKQINEASNTYDVYFDADGDGHLSGADAVIRVIGLNNAGVSWGSGPAE